MLCTQDHQTIVISSSAIASSARKRNKLSIDSPWDALIQGVSNVSETHSCIAW